MPKGKKANVATIKPPVRSANVLTGAFWQFTGSLRAATQGGGAKAGRVWQTRPTRTAAHPLAPLLLPVTEVLQSDAAPVAALDIGRRGRLQ